MLCGIDEAGRGPLAGPLVVAGAVIKKEIKGLADSKKLSKKKREELYKEIVKNCHYHIVFKSAKQIDKHGISSSLKSSIIEVMKNLKAEQYLMDGNTSFGIGTLQHKIKADASVKEVSAASILAKVSRDRYMRDIASKFPNYTFEKHKGYGTKDHIEKIKEFGRSSEHRYTFRIKALGEELIGIQKNLL